MAQWYGIDDLGDLSKTSSSTLDLADSYLRLGGQAYQTGLLTLDTAVSGVGGLDTGVIASNTVYSIYVVLDGLTSKIIGSLDTTSPLGFSIYSKVGVFTTDGSSNIDFVGSESALAQDTVLENLNTLNNITGVTVDAAGNGSFTTIQAAVNAASAGDKITVYAGTFTENLTVGKKIYLEGQGNSTIINGTVAFNASSNNSAWHFVKFNGNVTVANGVTGITLVDGYINPSAVLSDNNPTSEDSLYTLVEEL